MKQKDKVTAANKIVQFAKDIGFTGAYVKFIVEDEDEAYESIEEVANAFDIGDEVSVAIDIFLDDDLTFEVNSDEEIEYK